MSKTMQNLVVLMDPPKRTDLMSLKVGNMCLNRFCIDEDAAFELSGVHYFKKTEVDYGDDNEKGKDFSLSIFNFILVN